MTHREFIQRHTILALKKWNVICSSLNYFFFLGRSGFTFLLGWGHNVGKPVVVYYRLLKYML